MKSKVSQVEALVGAVRLKADLSTVDNYLRPVVAAREETITTLPGAIPSCSSSDREYLSPSMLVNPPLL